MAQVPTTTGNHSFQRYDGWSRYKKPAITTWGSGGNTCTISDLKIHANSAFFPWVTGTTPQSGFWSWTVSSGQVVITSSAVENTTLPINYVIF